MLKLNKVQWFVLAVFFGALSIPELGRLGYSYPESRELMVASLAIVFKYTTVWRMSESWKEDVPRWAMIASFVGGITLATVFFSWALFSPLPYAKEITLIGLGLFSPIPCVVWRDWVCGRVVPFFRCWYWHIQNLQAESETAAD